MTTHKTGTRGEWFAAREKLLARLGDELARQRRKLPWVRIDREYQFDTDEGTRTLAELFDGRYPILDRAPKGRDEGAAWQLWLRHDGE